MNVKKIDLPILPLRADLERLLADGIVKWHGNQMCVNTTVDHPDSTELGCASLIYDWDKSELRMTETGSQEYYVPLRDKILHDSDFNIVATPFRGTAFEEAFNLLSERYDIGRIRIIQSKPKTCMTWHNDETGRIHFPIKTQDGCFMIIEDGVHHLEESQWYWTDTTKQHTAMNGSKEDRIHLVVVVFGEKSHG